MNHLPTKIIIGSMLLLLLGNSATQAAQNKNSILNNDPLTTLSKNDTQIIEALEDSGFQLELIGSNKQFDNDRMMYMVSFQNTGFKASGNIDITAPVPPETTYLEDSAAGENCEIMFSVDGGENWDAPANLHIVDASGEKRQATNKDYTHIKWRYIPELRPAEIQQVSFQVKLH